MPSVAKFYFSNTKELRTVVTLQRDFKKTRVVTPADYVYTPTTRILTVEQSRPKIGEITYCTRSGWPSRLLDFIRESLGTRIGYGSKDKAR